MDRVDLRLEILPLTRADLAQRSSVEPSAAVAQRVFAAQDRARHRLRGTPWRLNADVPGRELRRRWPLTPECVTLLDARVSAGSATMRGADRILRVAWTLADLAGRDRPDVDDMLAAASLREAGQVAA